MEQQNFERAQQQLPMQPFAWPSGALPKRVLVGAALLTVVLMAAIFATNAPLENPAAPMGIVSLQLAGSLTAAEEILAAWGPAEQRWAIRNLVIDYPYLLAYATALGLACLLLARRFSGQRRMARLGCILSRGVMVAALLDAVENGALLRLLLGDLREVWVALAMWCAVPKYLLVLAALVYLSVGGLVCLIRKVTAA